MNLVELGPFEIAADKKLIIVDAHDTVLRRDLSRDGLDLFGEPGKAEKIVWGIRDGFLNFLDYYVGVQKRSVVISSDGSRQRLGEVFERFGITARIQRIYGGEHLDSSYFKRVDLILADLGVEPSQAVFIGDSILDQNSAKRAGVDFIRVPNSLEEPWFSFHVFLGEPFRSKSFGLEIQNIQNIRDIYRNLSTPELGEHCLHRKEAKLAHLGGLVVDSGPEKKLLDADYYIVREPSTESRVFWGGIFGSFAPDKFQSLYLRMLAFLQDRDIYIQDCFAGADREREYSLRVITQTAWHSLYIRNIFVQADREQLEAFIPEFTIIHMPHFRAIPEVDGTNGGAFVILNIARKLAFIGGTGYAGELRRAIFNLLTFSYTEKDVLPLQCSSNIGQEGDLALFFGDSSLNKSTMAMGFDRKFFGDAHHCWAPDRVFNLEWGAYPPVANLTEERSPRIYAAVRQFACILENVSVDEKRRLDLQAPPSHGNARAAFPITHVDGAFRKGVCGPPRRVFILVRDGTGLLPLCSRISPEQAVLFLLLGYDCDPETSGSPFEFRPCYDDYPALLHPAIYALLFWERLRSSGTDCWLLNVSHTGHYSASGAKACFQNLQEILGEIFEGTISENRFLKDELWGLEQVSTPIETEAGADRSTAFRSLSKAFRAELEVYGDILPEEILSSLPALELEGSDRV